MMRMMMVAMVGTAAMVSIAAASAPATAPADAALRMDDDEDPPAAASLYRVTGRHACAIEGSEMTFTCDVARAHQKTCEQGRAALEADDCCARTRAGGVSTELMNFTCTPM